MYGMMKVYLNISGIIRMKPCLQCLHSSFEKTGAMSVA